MTNERPINMKRSLKKRGSRPPALQLDLNNNSKTDFIPPQKFNNSNRRHSLAIQKITEIVKDKLYLGNESDANNYNTIKTTGITSIITLNSTILNPEVINLLSSRNGSWKHIPIRDRSSEQIIDIMEVLIDFIEKTNGKVLVHCQHGISRSSTIVMAYLMKTRNMTNVEAFELVKAKRPIVDPNFGFLTQLQRFDEILNSPSKVELPYSPEVLEERPKGDSNNDNKCPMDISRRIFKTFNFMDF